MLRFGCYLLIVLAFLAIQIEGWCFRSTLNSSTTIDASGNNVTEYYCEYQNQTYEINANWSYPYPMCFSCECNIENGLSCCGYGIEAGVLVPPEGCQLANGTCEVILVKTSDPSKSCFDTETSTSTQTTTKKRCRIKPKVLN